MMVKKELANHLKPVLCSILSEEEVHKIADHLQKKNVITLEGDYCYICSSLVFFKINT